MKTRKLRAEFAAVLIIAASGAISACNSSNGSAPGTVSGTGIVSGGGNTGVTSPPTQSNRTWSTDVLVFTGNGTWSTEIADAEALFTQHGLTYQEETSAQLDAMSVDDIAKFGMIFIPGGEGGTEAGSVSAQTHANLREAVQVRGVSYVGFCAGAFVAVAPAPSNGGDVSYGFGVVNGPVLNYYTGPGTSASYEQTLESFPDGHTENILWYGGPVTPNTGVIAKYPTGDPAISEMWSGAGYVIIAGVHPDLTQATLDGLGVSPDTPATDLAWQIFNAALHQQPLPTF